MYEAMKGYEKYIELLDEDGINRRSDPWWI